MRGAIMQPYFFPYIGYYQLAYEVERFVFLDDVNYIKKGFINRNAILLQNERHEFSVPVEKISQNRAINKHNYTGEFSKFLSLIWQAYKKAPFFEQVMPLVESVVRDGDNNVARKNAKSLTAVFSYLGIEREYIFSSDVELEDEKKGQDRILALCQKLNINKYRNAIGGRELYDKNTFNSAGIDLKFIQSNIRPYRQTKCEFVSHLSIIDILMHCDKEEIKHQLSSYLLI